MDVYESVRLHDSQSEREIFFYNHSTGFFTNDINQKIIGEQIRKKDWKKDRGNIERGRCTLRKTFSFKQRCAH